jgi:Fe-S oxidoreductase
MDVRDRVEEVSTNLQQNGPSFDDGKSLYGDYISQEELLACTSCNACADACPVNIDPLSIILDMRRYMIMEESKAPFAWNAMFSNMENNMAPWKFSPSDRFNWSKNINP